MLDRLTEEAHATGAVNTITTEGKRLVGHNTDVPGLQGRARQARRPPEDAPPGGRAGRRRRRAGRRLRAHPRGLPAGHRVQPPPPPRRGAGQALRPQRRAHGAAGDALARVDHRGRARQDEAAGQRDVDRARRPTSRRCRRDPPAGAAGARPDLRPRRASCATPRRPARRRPTARDAPPPGRGRVHAVDRASRRRSSVMQAALAEARAGGVALGRGRAGGRAGGRRPPASAGDRRASDGPLPVPDRRRIATARRSASSSRACPPGSP